MIVLAQTVVYVVEMIGVIVLARLLVPQDFGLVAMVTAFSMLLQNFGTVWFTEVVIQQEQLSHHQLSNFFWINVSMSVGIMVLFIASSPLLGWIYKEPRLTNIAIVMSATILFGGLSTHHVALLKRKLLFFRASFIQVLAAVGSIIIGISLAASGAGYWSLVLRRLSIPAITAVLAWVLCRWRPGVPSRGYNVRPMVVFAIRTYLSYCLTYAQRTIDKVLIGRFHGPTSLGNYDKAYHFTSLLPNQLTIPVTNVAIATMSRLRDNPEKFRHYFYFVFGIVAFVGMLGGAVLTVVGKDMIVIVLGSQWEDAGVVFTAFAPGIGMFLLYNMNQWLHFSLGRADRLLRWNIVAVIFVVASYAIGMPFGPEGVALAYSICFYVLLWPALWFAGKPIGITARQCFLTIWKYIASGAATCFMIWLAVNYATAIGSFVYIQSRAIRALLGFLAVTILYCLLVVILHRGTLPFGQLYTLLKQLRRSEKKTED